jgi:acyl-coenzyme A thioesterase PaaI-like protein
MVETRRGFVKATVPMDGNGNHLDTMYAGALFATAEILGGAIVVPSFDVTQVYPVVKDVNISFRRPARTRSRRPSKPTGRQPRRQAIAMGEAEFTLTA